MARLTFITGGIHSGKSHFAHDLATDRTGSVAYIATLVPSDEEMQALIERIRNSHPRNWHVIEQYSNLQSLQMNPIFMDSDFVILDSITSLISNLMYDSGIDYDTADNATVWNQEHRITTEITAFITLCRSFAKDVIIISNEVGQGVIPAHRIGISFRNTVGRINQLIADYSDEVYCLISGIPMKLK